jgi:hypothetical protein
MHWLASLKVGPGERDGCPADRGEECAAADRFGNFILVII